MKYKFITQITSGVAARIVGGLSGLILINVFIKSLGAAISGTLIIVLTVPTIIKIIDFGIPASLLNHVIDESSAKNTIHFRSLKPFLKFSACLSLFLLLVVTLFYSNLLLFIGLSNNQITLSHYDINLNALIFLTVILGLILQYSQLAVVISWGLGLGSIVNLLSSLADIASLVAIFLLIYNHPQSGLQSYIIILLGVPILTNLILITIIRKKIHFEYNEKLIYDEKTLLNSKSIIKKSWAYAIISVAGILAFQTDTYIVNFFLGPKSVVTLTVIWKVCGMVPVGLEVFSKPLWVSFSDLVKRKEFNKLWKRLKIASYSVAFISIILSMIIIIFHTFLFKILTPSYKEPISFAILVPGILVAIVSALDGPVSMALNATKSLKNIAKSGAIMAILNLFLGILLTPYLGLTGPLWASFISLGFVGFLYNLHSVHKWKKIQNLESF